MSTYVSEEGLKKLQEKLKTLKSTTRQEVGERLIEARSHGDLSENFEYKIAKEEQADLEREIAFLESKLIDVVLYKKPNKSDVVYVGSKVVLFDEIEDEEVEYTVTGALESDPKLNFVSNESPIGRAIVGRKKGERVEIIAPSGKFFMVIKNIK